LPGRGQPVRNQGTLNEIHHFRFADAEVRGVELAEPGVRIKNRDQFVGGFHLESQKRIRAGWFTSPLGLPDGTTG
jgi:hypothetical protein